MSFEKHLSNCCSLSLSQWGFSFHLNSQYWKEEATNKIEEEIKSADDCVKSKGD